MRYVTCTLELEDLEQILSLVGDNPSLREKINLIIEIEKQKK